MDELDIQLAIKMKSPIGDHPTLEKITLEDGLLVYRCPDSGGLYIRSEDFWRWRHQQQVGSDGAPPTEEYPVSEYDDEVKVCPETGTLMVRYRVGHGVPCRIDRSITGGVWLDAGEWEALRREGLHRQLNLIFTSPWQKAVRDAELEAQNEARLCSRLGDDLFARIQAFREEIWSHPSSAEAIAYLQNRPKGVETRHAPL